MRPIPFLQTLLASGLLCALPAHSQTVTISFPAARADKPLDGRLLFLVSNDPNAMTDPKLEPRMQIDDTPKTQMVFGVTVDGWKPGRACASATAPRAIRAPDLKDMPPGDYTVQAVLNVYETSTARTARRSSWRRIVARASTGTSRRAICCRSPRRRISAPGAPPIALRWIR